MEESELWSAYRNTPEKERGKLREPAQAIAVAKCLLARLDYTVGDSHPDPCTMCKVSGERLWPIYEEWMQWSGLNDPDNKHPTLEMFEQLPADVQHKEVRKAQGYVRQVHQTPDSDHGDQPDPLAGVAEDGGQPGGQERRDDLGEASRVRTTGRTSRGVRRGQSTGTPDTNWATGGQAAEGTTGEG